MLKVLLNFNDVVMRNNWSGISVFLVLLTALVIDHDLKLWDQKDRVIEHDARIYYGYLPAFFIFDDLRMEKSSYEYEDGKSWFWTVNTEKGKRVFKMSCGLAIMNAPFFLIAHQTAQWYDYPLNGFSEPYKLFLILGAAFYLFVGLWFVRAVLIHLGFTDMVTAIVVLLIGLSSNLLFYATSSAAMSHTASFALVAAFLYLTLRWNDERKVLHLAGIGLVFGLITLVRPTNGIVFLIFLLYSILGPGCFRNWKEWVLSFFFFALGIGLAWFPQIAYWWHVAGEYLVYSYGDERFFWSAPEIRQVLLGFRNGWWIYTPVMFFVIPGFFLMRTGESKWLLPLTVVYMINLYVISSWWCWWYGGSYGQRAFVDTYALWSIPLAATVRGVVGSKAPLKLLSTMLALFFVWLNIFQLDQVEHRSLHHDAMTKRAYFKQFGKLTPVEGIESTLVYPDYESALKGDR